MTSPAEQAAFLERNAVESLPADGLRERLALAAHEARPLRVKLGLDPTAPDLHLGHVVVLTKLREFQDLGHRVVLIVGDYTARVGDPSGRSTTRPALSGEAIDENAATYRRQASKVMREDAASLEVRYNAEWLDMAMDELFRLARTATVAQILERNDFATRFRAGTPISVLELLYPLLQGYDSVAIDADVEIGGTDQTFNLMLGRDVQRAYDRPEQSVLTLPLLRGTDGVEKMSKSLGNQIGVTDAPDEMYGKTLSIADELMDEWFSLLGVDDPTARDGEATSPRDRKRALARALVTRFHDADAAAAAERNFDRVFVRHEAPDDVSDHTVATPDGTVHVPQVIAEAFGRSRSEARRLLSQGAVRLDGDVLGADEVDVSARRAEGALLQVGKRAFVRLHTDAR